MKNTIKHIFILFCILIISVVIGYVCLIASYLIPYSAVRSNIDSVSQVIDNEGGQNQELYGQKYLNMDSFTTIQMSSLGANGYQDEEETIVMACKDSLLNKFISNKGFPVCDSRFKNDKDTYISTKSRYWHGYNIIVKPLFIVFDYTLIRYIFFFIELILLIAVLVLLKNKGFMRYWWSFILFCIAATIPLTGFSFHLSTAVITTLVACIILIVYHKKLNTIKKLSTLFFIVGIVINYLDFLSFPFMTFCIPFLIYIILNFYKFNLKQWLKILICSLISWFAGYGLMWFSKWLLASIVLEKNVFVDAYNQILFRTSNTNADGIEVNIFSVSLNNIFYLKQNNIFVCMAIVYILVFFFICIKGLIKHEISFCWDSRYWLYIIFTILPFVWYFCMKNHSYIHSFQTYRLLSISIMAFFAFLTTLVFSQKATKIFSFDIMGKKYWKKN